MSTCQYERLDGDNIRCTLCGHVRTWSRPGRMPKRNCPTLDARAILRGPAPATAGGDKQCGTCGEPSKPPSIVKRAWNYVTHLASYIADGLADVDEREYTARLAVCQGCPARGRGDYDRTCLDCGCPIEAKARPRSEACPRAKWPGEANYVQPAILIRTKKGFGDHLTFTAVLKHLAELRPDLAIDIQCRPQFAGLFAGLCRRVFSLGAAAPGPYAHTMDLAYGLPKECFAGHGSTAAERHLLQVHAITPRPEWCRYHVASGGRQPPDTDAPRQRLPSPIRIPLNPGRCLAQGDQGADAPRSPYVVIHHQGKSAPEKKNLSAADLRPTVEGLLSAGYRVLLLDRERKSPLRKTPGVETLVRGPWDKDARALVDLCRGAALCIGIDSGPGHAMAASGVQTIIVTYGKHPVHCFFPCANVLHLVSCRLNSRLETKGDQIGAAVYFRRHYRHAYYTDLPADLWTAVRERLASGGRQPPDLPARDNGLGSMESGLGMEVVGAGQRYPATAGRPCEYQGADAPRSPKRPEITIITLQGIGDIAWVHRLLSPHFERINYTIRTSGNQRMEVQRRFKEWEGAWAGMGQVTFLPSTPAQVARLGSHPFSVRELLARYDAGETTQEFAANQFLEAGVNLEDIEPGLPVNWDLGLKVESVEESERHLTSYVSVYKGYTCVYVCGDTRHPKAVAGGVWSVDDWDRFLAELVHLDNQLVFVGAAYDGDVLRELHRRRRARHGYSHLVLDATPAEALGIIAGSRCFISYQSGLAVLAEEFSYPATADRPSGGLMQVKLWYGDAVRKRVAWTWPRPANRHADHLHFDFFDRRPAEVLRSIPWRIRSHL